MFIYRNSDGEFDLDGEYARGQSDAASGEYDPPSRDPVQALGDAVFGDNDDFEAAERAYEAGYADNDE